MKKIFFTIIFLNLSMLMLGQQEAMFTHFAFNSLAVNPGYAGSREALTVTGLHRSQWVSFPGSPKTQTLTVHTPIHNEKIGVGLSVINDEIGIVNTTSVYGDFAYKLKVGEGLLALGLKGGINVRSTKLTDVALVEEDPTFQTDISSKVLPNFGFGLYYSAEKYYVGLSTTKLLLNDLNTNVVSGDFEKAKESRHLYLITGAVFDVFKTVGIKVRPQLQVKHVAYAPITIDLNTTLLYKDRFWIGPMARLGDGIGGLVGFQFNDQISVGYSFDWSMANATGRFNDGSHEIMLRYDFIYKEKQSTISPRYF